MTVNELIDRLTMYAAQRPENAAAEVALKFDGVCFAIAGADDCWGMPGTHLLALVPDERSKIAMKELRIN